MLNLLIVLDDVGRAPYSLLREALCKATPQQLDRIERINPVSQIAPSYTLPCLYHLHLTWIHLFCSASDPRINWYINKKQNSISRWCYLAIYYVELWLPHCLSFSDIREAYNQDVYPEFTDWRQLYHVSILLYTFINNPTLLTLTPTPIYRNACKKMNGVDKWPGQRWKRNTTKSNLKRQPNPLRSCRVWYRYKVVKLPLMKLRVSWDMGNIYLDYQVNLLCA